MYIVNGKSRAAISSKKIINRTNFSFEVAFPFLLKKLLFNLGNI